MSYLAPPLQAFPDIEQQQPSLLAHFEPQRSTLPKTHFVEWFSGSALSSRWNTRHVGGTSTFQMADVINGGFEIITDTGDNDAGQIDYNTLNHYDDSASVFIGVVQRVNALNSIWFGGLDGTDMSASTTERAVIRDDTDVSNKEGVTSNGSSSTATSLGVAIDTVATLYKIETLASSVNFHVNEILGATITTTLPDSGVLMPGFMTLTRTTGAGIGRIRYLEAYNT